MALSTNYTLSRELDSSSYLSETESHDVRDLVYVKSNGHKGSKKLRSLRLTLCVNKLQYMIYAKYLEGKHQKSDISNIFMLFNIIKLSSMNHYHSVTRILHVNVKQIRSICSPQR